MTIANLIKELREKTGAGMLECKNALIEVEHNLEQAIDYLRKKGLANAAKKAGNIAADGLIAIKIMGNKGAIIELNSQTDFVARNEQFQNLANLIVDVALKVKDLKSLEIAKLANGKIVSEEITENIAKIGENINLRRFNLLEIDKGIIFSYIHNKVAEGLGSIGVLVTIESDIESTKLQELGKQISMHIAAAKPYSLDIASLSNELIAREKNIAAEQSKASGKPDNVVEKMVEGRMRKFYEEAVLLEQKFVMDPMVKVGDLITNKAKELGGNIKIVDFVKYEIGEGIIQETKNFADEVAAVIKG